MKSFDAIDLYIETSNRTEHTNGPLYIRVRVDPDFLAMTLRRRDFCIAEHLKNVTQALAPAHWDKSNSDINAWELLVDNENFWFHGKDDDDGELISGSHSIPIELLLKWVHGRQSIVDVKSEAEMLWIGHCLLYSDYELDDFSVAILDRCPEVAAQKLALDMTERIAQNVAAPVNIEPMQGAKRRRLGGV